MGKKADRGRDEKARAKAKADERRRVVLRVYEGCDATRDRVLANLAKRGVTPTCSAGCAHCCSLEIPTSRAEGEALVAWLVEHKSPDELAAIRDRLRAWLAWYRVDYPKLVASGVSRVQAFFRYAPKCALLEANGYCGAYDARPVTCRNHFVRSPVSECDPATGTGEPDAILDVAKASYDYVVELRRVVEAQGGNYMATIHLLPEWLVHLLEIEREPWQGSEPLQLG